MGSGSAQPRSRKFSDTAPSAGMWVSRNANDQTPLANSPDWLKAAPMRENLLASWRQSGQKQDPCPSLLNHNAKYMQLLPPYCDFANGVGALLEKARLVQHQDRILVT